MIKKYLIKISDKENNFLGVISPELVKTEISFGMFINGSQEDTRFTVLTHPSDANLKSITNYGEGSFIKIDNFIRVFQVDEENPKGRLIYTGIIDEYEPFLTGTEQGIHLNCVGKGSLLGNVYYKASPTVFEIVHATSDPSAIALDIADRFNSEYGNIISADLIDDGGAVEELGTLVNYTATDKKMIDAMNDAKNLTAAGWYWFVDAAGKLFFRSKPITPTHTFTIGKDLESVSIKKTAKKLCNRFRLDYTGGSKIYEDTSDYLPREKIVNDSSLSDIPSADQKGNKKLAEDKKIKESILLKVNSFYDLESILPGDTVRLKIPKEVGGESPITDNLQIVRVFYRPDKVEIELEEQTRSFVRELKDAINNS